MYCGEVCWIENLATCKIYCEETKTKRAVAFDKINKKEYPLRFGCSFFRFANSWGFGWSHQNRSPKPDQPAIKAGCSRQIKTLNNVFMFITLAEESQLLVQLILNFFNYISRSSSSARAFLAFSVNSPTFSTGSVVSVSTSVVEASADLAALASSGSSLLTIFKL